mmetsp:Transcript_33716/g.81754  ORF Transcript_33716/g.81754 Transcript_33716/m.81754 type:complete len:511 (-) Transcript_33716:990-2522(-)
MTAEPEIYMTPQLAKRKDGLCPSLLIDEVLKVSTSKGGGPSHAAISKSYQTNTKYLTESIRQLENESEELKFISDSVNKFLKEYVDNSDDFSGISFEPKGCTWKLELDIDKVQAPDYRIQVICMARASGDKRTTFVVDTTLVGKSDKSISSTSLPGFKEAKATFEATSLVVRKAVVRCEFPEFPEGCKGRIFREVYQLNARLKSGSFATVCRGTHRASGKKVAIKCVLRKDLPPNDDAAIYDEVAIMSSLTHPHIVPLIDFFEEKDCYFLVMELMSGGDLFDRIGKKKTYSEADARDLTVKMLKFMAFCHAHNIAHCDMKPKNLLLMSEDNDSYIKLADFGFAARCHAPKSLTKQCGTPFFVSPEILMRQPYDQQSDMWSVGCIIFLLLSGNLPFMGRSQKELFKKIVSGKFEFDADDWCDVSDDAKDLVKQLLVLDPDQRLTSAEALKHRWMRASDDRLRMMALTGTSQRLKTFNARMKLRSAMIAVDWVSSLKKTSWISSRNLNKESS